MVKELKERVAKGLHFGMEALEKSIAPKGKAYNDFVQIKSKYNDLMHLSGMGTLPYEQIEIGLNRLRSALLQLIDQMEGSDWLGQELDKNLAVSDLANRRSNFFKLLEIHQRNLDDIAYIVSYSGGGEDAYRGREALFQRRKSLLYRFEREVPEAQRGELAAVQAFFQTFFANESGAIEVYMKHSEHMLRYVMADQVEQGFFLDTLRALYSRFELFFLFYYALSDSDPQFDKLLLGGQLIGAGLRPLLLHDAHWALWSALLERPA